MFETNGLKQLAVDLYNDQHLVYNNTSGQDAMRKIVADALEMEVGTPINHYSWEANKLKVFQILSVAIDAVLPTILTNQFDTLADVRNVAVGDQPRFEIEDNSLLRVGMIAAGTQDLQRQELHGGSFTVDTDWYGAKIYVEFERFLAGNVNWQTLVNRVALSFTNKMQTQIYEAFAKSYDAVRTVRKATGTYDEDKLIGIAQHIQTASGGKPVAVYGTLSALRKVSKGADASSTMKDKIAKVGYLDTVGGLDLIALPQAYKAGTEEFAIDDNTLLVLPQGEKIVSVVLEGDAIVNDTDPMVRNDMQREFVTMKKYGLQVAKLSIYGMYKIS